MVLWMVCLSYHVLALYSMRSFKNTGDQNMTPSPTDLFGEVPVTVPDLYLWCAKVMPHISAARLDYYIHSAPIIHSAMLSRVICTLRYGDQF